MKAAFACKVACNAFKREKKRGRMVKYKYLLFDLDDTLLHFGKTENYAFHESMQKFGLEVAKGNYEIYHEINKRKWLELNEGLITKKDLVLSRFEEYFQMFEIKNVNVKAFNDLYEIELGKRVFYVDDAVETLQKLCKYSDIYIVTNGTKTAQKNRMAKCEFRQYIKGVFISEEVGYNKPSIEYFNYVFAKIPEFDKESALIIGDSLSADIRGGNNAGIDTCWFNSKGKAHNGIDNVDYEIKYLKELNKVIFVN